VSSREQQKAEARAVREASEKAAAVSAARRRRLMQLGGAAVAIAVVAVAAVLITSHAAGTPKTGAVQALFEGIPQDGLALGDPDAPTTLTEYVDLQCPICRRYVLDTLPTVVNELVRTGDLRIEMAPIAILGPDSVTGADATVAASQQNLAWQFADTLYRNQGAEGSGYLDQAFVQKIAGLTPGLDPAKLTLDSPEVVKEVTRINGQAKDAGINSTPSFVLGKTGEQGQLFQGDFSDPAAFVAQIKEASGG
jgi:protein-disulfide isomerase